MGHFLKSGGDAKNAAWPFSRYNVLERCADGEQGRCLFDTCGAPVGAA